MTTFFKEMELRVLTIVDIVLSKAFKNVNISLKPNY